VLSALSVMKLKTVDDVPVGFLSDAHKQRLWLDRLSEQIVDFVWLGPSHEDIQTVANAYIGTGATSPYCVCKSGKLKYNSV